jgi:ribosomal protein L11 methyltransferase
MPLKSLILRVPAGCADAVSDSLLEAGAQSISVEDAHAGTAREQPIYAEPGATPEATWNESLIGALLDEHADVARFVRLASQTCHLPGTLPYRIEEVPDDDWVRRTEAQFGPINAAPGIWIVPSWEQPVEPGALNIRLDPGLAFGTGSHATTQLCLRWLQSRAAPERSFLDYGCGSGILAIAAARLGARPVCGIDIDEQAIDAARANAKRNGVAVRFFAASKTPARRFDLVVANILANPLRVLAPALAGYVRRGGFIALSGILESQSEELLQVYQPYFNMRRFADQQGWVCLEGARR